MLMEEAKAGLRHALESGRVPHACIFVGSPRGAAAELAVFFMQLLACQGPGAAPCGGCDACRQIAARTWCDSLWLSPMKKSRVISVQQMRRGQGNKLPPPYFLSWLEETSFLGGWKFGVVAGAECMNASAANAFLKMLEEPPARTVLLLLTGAPQQLLPTIRSRCCIVELAEPPPELEERRFAAVMALLSGADETGPLAAAALSNRLCAILAEMQEEAAQEARSDAREEEEEGRESDREQEDALAAALYRERRSLLVLTLLRWCRDLLALRAGGGEGIVHYRACLDSLRARAKRLTLAQALANVEAVEELSRQLDRSLPEAVVLPCWLDRLSLGAPVR